MKLLKILLLITIPFTLNAQEFKFGEFDFQRKINLPNNVREILSIIDLNNDGKDDLIVSQGDSKDVAKIEIYINLGDSKFSKILDNQLNSFDLVNNKDIRFHYVNLSGNNRDIIITSREVNVFYKSNGEEGFDIGQPIFSSGTSLIDLEAISYKGKRVMLASIIFPNSTYYNYRFELDEFGKLTKSMVNPFNFGDEYYFNKSLDIDNDGNSDLLVFSDSNKVSVYMNNGVGEYTISSLFNLPSIEKINYIDINNDEFIDFYIQYFKKDTTLFLSYINDQKNGFQLDSNYIVEIPKFFKDHILEDYNKDGKFDVTLIENNFPGQNFETFVSDVNSKTYKSINIQYFDNIDNYIFNYDNENNNDILLHIKSNGGNSSFDFLKNENGFFKSISLNPLSWERLHINRRLSNELDVLDYNNDGFEDIMVWEPQSSIYDSVKILKVYLNNGKGQFYQGFALSEPQDKQITYKNWADFNGDGLLDLVVGVFDNTEFANVRPIVYLNNEAGILNSFENSFVKGNYFGSGEFENVHPGDINADGKIDLISFFEELGFVYFENNNNSRLVKKGNTIINNSQFRSLLLSDLDNDGDSDIIFFDSKGDNNTKISVEINDGNGNFTAVSQNLFSNLDYTNILLKDFNNDKLMDIVVINEQKQSSTVTIYKNEGNDEFTKLELSFLSIYENINLDFADLDLDGDLDFGLFAYNRTTRLYNKALYINDGTYNYESKFNENINTSYIGKLILKDIDNDKYPDWISQHNNQIDIQKNLYNSTTFVSEAHNSNYLIYPSPFTNSVNIKSKKDLAINSVRIYDLEYKYLIEYKINSNEAELDLNLNTGVYFFELLLLNGQKEIIKVIKE